MIEQLQQEKPQFRWELVEGYHGGVVLGLSENYRLEVFQIGDTRFLAQAHCQLYPVKHLLGIASHDAPDGAVVLAIEDLHARLAQVRDGIHEVCEKLGIM